MMPTPRNPQREAWTDEIISGFRCLAADPNSCTWMLMESAHYADEEAKAMVRWMVAMIRVLQDPRPDADKIILVPKTFATDLGSWR